MLEASVGRRSVLKRITAAAAGIAALLGLGYLGSRPSAAIESDDSFIAEDVRVERNDGELRAVTVQPELDLVWEDFGDGVESVELTLSASLDGEAGFDVLFDGSLAAEPVVADGDSLDATDGSTRISFDRRDMTAVGTNVTLGDFGGELDPGESKATGVDLTLRTDVVGGQGETVTAVETTTFDVTVHNPEGDAAATGRANTDAK